MCEMRRGVSNWVADAKSEGSHSEVRALTASC